MLIEFKFSNYRSFRDEAVLSMEATGLGTFRKSLIEYRLLESPQTIQSIFFPLPRSMERTAAARAM